MQIQDTRYKIQDTRYKIQTLTGVDVPSRGGIQNSETVKVQSQSDESTFFSFVLKEATSPFVYFDKIG